MQCSYKDVADNAVSWLNVPWRHQGRSRRGIDCVGVVIMLAHELGLSDFDTTAYARSPNGVDFLTGFKKHMDRVAPGEERPGDVVVMRDSVLPCHCGVLVQFRGETHLIHAAARRKKVVIEPFKGGIKAKKIAVFRYRGLVD
jgi:cell wall-associated NlpC family hydrolase